MMINEEWVTLLIDFGGSSFNRPSAQGLFTRMADYHIYIVVSLGFMLYIPYHQSFYRIS